MMEIKKRVRELEKKYGEEPTNEGEEGTAHSSAHVPTNEGEEGEGTARL